MNSTQVLDGNGELHDVRCHCAFMQQIDGHTFNFTVTDDLSDVGLNVCHADSGKRVCRIPDSLDTSSWIEGEALSRARDALLSLINMYGEIRVAIVLSGARALPPAE